MRGCGRAGLGVRQEPDAAMMLRCGARPPICQSSASRALCNGTTATLDQATPTARLGMTTSKLTPANLGSLMAAATGGATGDIGKARAGEGAESAEGAARTGPAATEKPVAGDPADDAPRVVAIYRAEGGFAGVRDTLTVCADGATALELRPGSEARGTATATQVADLTRLIATREFASAASQYGHNHGIDRTTYVIVAAGKTITIAGAATLPKPVAEAQAILNALMSALR